MIPTELAIEIALTCLAFGAVIGYRLGHAIGLERNLDQIEDYIVNRMEKRHDSE